MKTIDTVIFDLDGTLLNTLDDLADSVNYALKAFDFPIHTRDSVRKMVGNGIYVLMEKAIPDGRENPQYNPCVSLFKDYYFTHMKVKTAPFDGIMPMIEQLQKHNLKLAIVSNKFDSAVKELCQDFFTPYITTSIGQSDSIEKKPAPDTVFMAMEQLHTSPESSIYVGDSDVDIDTANNSGIPYISVSWGFKDREFLENYGAKQIVDTVEDLQNALLSAAGIQ